MANTAIASGKTVKATVAAISDTDNTYSGVAGGADEILSVQMTVGNELLLAGETARFTNVLLKVNGSAGSDKFTGTDNAESISGAAGNDKLFGNGGNDTIDGGVGKDVMFGGTGDDTYVVDNAGDKVTEVSGAGTDTVKSSINYTLGANVENLTLTGAAANGAGNALDNEITGNAKANVLVGNAGNDTLNGGVGKDSMAGGTGNDTYVIDASDVIAEAANEGTDTIIANFSYTLKDNFENLTLTGTADIDGDGNAANNVIIGNAGDNVLDGGDGNDSLSGGDGDDILLGGEGNNTLNGGAGADILSAGDGNNTFIFDREDTLIIGAGAGSDTYVIDDSALEDMLIDGGTSSVTGDQLVNVVNFTGTSQSTVASTLGSANALDTIKFTQSGDFTNLEFVNVERVELASGVGITLSAEAVTEAYDSLDVDGVNPGVHFYGVAGGAAETVTIQGDYDEAFTFTPAATVVGATPVVYTRADFQLDDATIGDLFHNVNLVTDLQAGSAALVTAHPGKVYAREDGSNSNETILGSEGVDNADGRLGNDLINGNGGNDLLKGQGGADTVNGGDGNDIMLIGGFATGVLGAYGKADDGNAEWVAGDVINGGAGVDTLRITVGANAADHTITLTDANFIGMERVEVGATVGRLNVENSDLQLLNDHFFLNAGQTVTTTNTVFTPSSPLVGGTVTKDMNLIVVDASGITDGDADGATGGLTFVGNGNVQTFIGTANNDTFIGNGGNDVLTGGAGADTFQFGKVHTQTVTGAATTVQTYTDVAANLTGIDTITDFTSGSDHIALDNDFFAAFVATGAISADNFVSGAGAVAADADDFLAYDTSTGALYYDADGNGGASAAVQIATLTGMPTLADTDFTII
ncbi:MAG: calcium-binding protein [Methylotenera sp.]|nr:calcium-binding protein [Methylotenera sp.]